MKEYQKYIKEFIKGYENDDYKYNYENPFHNPDWEDSYGPSRRVYSTNKEPIEYNGFLIFQRMPDLFDVVKDSKIITMRAGLNGARRFIDDKLAGKETY